MNSLTESWLTSSLLHLDMKTTQQNFWLGWTSTESWQEMGKLFQELWHSQKLGRNETSVNIKINNLHTKGILADKTSGCDQHTQIIQLQDFEEVHQCNKLQGGTRGMVCEGFSLWI